MLGKDQKPRSAGHLMEHKREKKLILSWGFANTPTLLRKTHFPFNFVFLLGLYTGAPGSAWIDYIQYWIEPE